MSDVDEVIKVWEEAIYWLKQFKENPEDPIADVNCVSKAKEAIKKYIEWICEDGDCIATFLKELLNELVK